MRCETADDYVEEFVRIDFRLGTLVVWQDNYINCPFNNFRYQNSCVLQGQFITIKGSREFNLNQFSSYSTPIDTQKKSLTNLLFYNQN